MTAINDGKLGALIYVNLDLAERFPQRVTVIRIALKAAHADHKALVQRGGDTHLATELIAHPRFAFGDAVRLGL